MPAPIVAVDCNGADRGPGEVAAGALLAAREGVRTLLFGPELELSAALAGHGEQIEIVDAPLSIAKSPDPASAVREHPQASIVQAARAVAAGRAHALVCAGGTGAALAACLFNVKRARGIHRPALALPLPVPGGAVTLLDVGANAQARVEHLEQFAFMGAALAHAVLGVANPRVGLLSNGAEPERGSELVRGAHARLAHVGAAAGGAGEASFRFVGNIEGGDVVSGVADVIVTDGFTGNVALKLMEGVSQTMLEAIRGAAMSSSRAKLGGALLRPGCGAFAIKSIPSCRAAPTCWACAGSAWCRTAVSRARASRGRSCAPARERARTWWTHARGPAGRRSAAGGAGVLC